MTTTQSEPDRIGPELSSEQFAKAEHTVTFDNREYKLCPICEVRMPLNPDWGFWFCPNDDDHVWRQGRFEGGESE